MIIVGRHIEGITINPLEYLLDEKGEVMKFINKEEAKRFLHRQGLTDEDIYWLVFKAIAAQEKEPKSSHGASL